MRLGIAIKAFFAALFDRQMAPQIERLLAGQPVSDSDTQPQAEPDAQRPRQPMQQPLSRDPAVTLLATLQREARLVDLVHEDLRQYSDAQVGAAARPCLQQCAVVWNRCIGDHGVRGTEIDADGIICAHGVVLGLATNDRAKLRYLHLRGCNDFGVSKFASPLR